MRTGAALHGPPGRHERRRGPRLWRIGEAQDVYRCRPPVSGKSTVFPVSGFGVEFFNADDLAAQLNRGSYQGIPLNIRDWVNRLFESFVGDCIARRTSFAVETTLRSSITFDQAATARRTTLPSTSNGSRSARTGRSQRSRSRPAEYLRFQPAQSCAGDS